MHPIELRESIPLVPMPAPPPGDNLSLNYPLNEIAILEPTVPVTFQDAKDAKDAIKKHLEMFAEPIQVVWSISQKQETSNDTANNINNSKTTGELDLDSATIVDLSLPIPSLGGTILTDKTLGANPTSRKVNRIKVRIIDIGAFSITKGMRIRLKVKPEKVESTFPGLDFNLPLLANPSDDDQDVPREETPTPPPEYLYIEIKDFHKDEKKSNEKEDEAKHRWVITLGQPLNLDRLESHAFEIEGEFNLPFKKMSLKGLLGDTLPGIELSIGKGFNSLSDLLKHNTKKKVGVKNSFFTLTIPLLLKIYFPSIKGKDYQPLTASFNLGANTLTFYQPIDNRRKIHKR